MTGGSTFAINGRFLTQRVTGVQRYARNVASAMNMQLAADGASIPIITPQNADEPQWSALEVRRVGPLGGHPWEQLILPRAWPGRLLSLCNTAPALKHDQVVCIHDASVFLAPDSFGRAFRLAYRALLPLLARRSLRIATVSAYSARQIAQFLPVQERDIVILPNGHEHALLWDPARARIGPRLNRNGAAPRPFVFALGSRARHKNLSLLLAAAPALDEHGIDIVIAGGGAGIFAAEDFQPAANIKMAGYLSDDDIAYMMDNALCLAFPSLTEGFGLPIVEAMARGCPVVSSNCASMPEVCGDAALLAAPDDVAGWVRHFLALRDAPALRDELVGCAKRRLHLFSWETTAAGYLDLMDHPSRAKVSAPAPTQELPRVAVIIATLGRPSVVSDTLQYLVEKQTHKPALVIVSCASESDAGSAARLPGVKVVVGPAGLPAQRNTGLAALPEGIDVVVFFDDDFVADAQWLETAAQVFRDKPDVVGFTGDVVRDDIKGPGLGFGEAVRIIEGSRPDPGWTVLEPYSPYGCNMAFRRSAIGNLRFDERLVLYGWLEDRDFSAALARRGGRFIKYSGAQGVHMGVKGGRVAGERLGYSQIVNPFYMLRKGTMRLDQVADHVFRNVTSNVVGSVAPEPFIDRRGRLRGNFIGLADVVFGKLTPERAASLARKP